VSSRADLSPPAVYQLIASNTAISGIISLNRAIEERIEMPQGTVKMFKTDKGFGFITPNEGGADVYVHVSELEKTGLSSLSMGQRVTFEVESDPVKGKTRAVNVHIT
jgi:CspA family cold shock protein